MAAHSAQPDISVVASDDLDLVHASKNGDAAAFEQLVRKYDRRLLRIAQSVTRNREDSQDAVQETFLKAFQKLAEFREDSTFSTWLTRITVNQSLMKLRKQRTIREVDLVETFQEDGDVLPLDVPDRSPNPEQLCWASELRDIFIKTMEGLRPILRSVFMLRDVEGLTIDQTAEVLSISQEAVKARLRRVRLELRERLNKYLNERTDSPRKWALPKGTRRYSTLGFLAECLRRAISQPYSIGVGQPTTRFPKDEATNLPGV